MEKSYYFDGMNRSLLSLIILCLPATALFSQEVNVVTLKAPKPRQVKSRYNAIAFLDSRPDTSAIGTYHYGAGDKFSKLVLKTPLQPQLADVLGAYAIAPEGQGEILFQLRRFSFAEWRETKYVYLKVSVYAKRDDRYLPLSTLDTTMVFDNEWAFQNSLETTSSGILDNFIAYCIGQPGEDYTTYSYDDVVNIDSIEKRRILAYNVAAFNEGLYSNYAAFKSQTPDLKGDVKANSDGTLHVKIHNPEWRDPKEGRHIFAVVYGGVPYIVTHFGYYPLEKKNDDFYFTGKLRLAATRQDKAAAQFAFGMVGKALAAEKGMYRVLIDHTTGEFIHLKVLD